MIRSAKISTTIILMLALVIIVNILSENYNFRIDLTEGKEFTLKQGNKGYPEESG